MDERKPEDELKPDPSDRRPVRAQKSAEYDNDPQINVDDIDVDDEDDRRPARRRSREEREEPEMSLDDDTLLDEENQEDDDAEPAVERRRPRKKAPSRAPASRQRLMMGVGILVLLVLIVGIGAALKTPSSDAETASQGGEKNIDLASPAGDSTAPAAQPAPGVVDQTAANGQQPVQPQQEVTLPPVSSQPTLSQPATAPAGQQRVEVQGDLNTALTQPAGQQVNQVASTATLPTQPATVAPVNGQRHQSVVRTPAEPVAPASQRREPEPRKAQPVQSKPQAVVKNTVTEPKTVVKAAPAPAPVKETVKAPVKETVPAQTAKTTPAATTAPKATAPAAATETASKAAPAATAAATAGAAVSSGNVDALKTAPSSHYTLQLSSSSNYNNLNAWAKKENLKNFVVYQTKRNGQPWYVLVSGVYASKEDAKHAVSSLPADVQAKNPWAKPIHQVQSDLKQ
ncbi:cell division protein DamX [Shimwellia blattae]|uniref:Cell division protein DamX n=1 Tax=Shimwellia blattae (strain ATCC 29907 / DSM 4481 / JCM 1650 / NBRC 105725 / CDC 9005-74) TaxID=630626 RepID=I2B4C3_SHIBC|nr:cell division protein DamX [Shimwellia blattae]AFJ45377.1 putative membrane protein [Shimwellia blattae DSM 4481 = NBRC 105725]GAB82864.1 DamX protein [Shimwellia blattae DSM 4481 = NBRC 105725]VDY62859.1 cell division protein DamX [Shimwellia blattae]VEC19772.1 cell division protein DamX [Shimwellia blattae]